MEKIMVDTSAIYALLDRSDSMHEEAKKCFTVMAKENVTTIITNFIKAECQALISSRLGHDLARNWLRKGTLNKGCSLKGKGTNLQQCIFALHP